MLIPTHNRHSSDRPILLHKTRWVNQKPGPLDGLVRVNTTENPYTSSDHATLELMWYMYLQSTALEVSTEISPRVAIARSIEGRVISENLVKI